MKHIKTLTIIVLIAIHATLMAQPTTYSNEAIRTDLAYLKCKLEQYHPNLYTYSSKEQIDRWFEEQLLQLPETISKKDAFKIITSIAPLLKDGHAYIYPSAEHLNAFYNTAPLFPLDVFLMNDQLVVVGQQDSTQRIPLGSVITKINGTSVEEIQASIVQHIGRDGDNLGYPQHLFYKFFPAYYSFFYGFSSTFDIEYISTTSERKAVSIQGQTRAAMRTMRNDEVSSGIQLQLIPSSQAAILTIKSFDKTILKKDYQQRFKKEISKAFQIIASKGITHLAVDLRDNQGGALSNGIYLLQYLLQNPFQCVHSYYVMRNGKRKQLHTKWDNYFKPRRKHHFEGEVFLFLNGGSYSCSAIVANTFKDSERGQILGEMSGGSAYVNSGGPNELITLPNTKITFTIPRTQYNLRAQLHTIGLGVVPDIVVPDTPNRILNDGDPYIETFKHLIE
ncbi:MAG: S41 family peptidase [Bacteroidota bacterium]